MNYKIKRTPPVSYNIKFTKLELALIALVAVAVALDVGVL